MAYTRAVTMCPQCLARTTHETCPTPAGEFGEWWTCMTCGLDRGPARTEVDAKTGLPLRDPQLVPVIGTEDLPAAIAEARDRHEQLLESFGPRYAMYAKGHVP